jgi:hypothetical protein
VSFTAELDALLQHELTLPLVEGLPPARPRAVSLPAAPHLDRETETCTTPPETVPDSSSTRQRADHLPSSSPPPGASPAPNPGVLRLANLGQTRVAKRRSLVRTRRADGGPVAAPRDHLCSWRPSFRTTRRLPIISRVSTFLLRPRAHTVIHPLVSEMASRILTALAAADEGEDQQQQQQAWATPSVSDDHDESPPSSPSFAPVGRPMVKKHFRAKLPHPLPVDIPRIHGLRSLRNTYSVRVSPWRIVLRRRWSEADRAVLS